MGPRRRSVKPNTYYTFSDWYKSDRSSAVSVYYELKDDPKDADGEHHGHWANLFSGIAPASDWTQYKTGFTMPADAVRAQFVHFIAGQRLSRDRRLLADRAGRSARLQQADGQPDLRRRIQGFWDNARGPLNAKGFKTTQYLPTAGLRRQ